MLNRPTLFQRVKEEILDMRVDFADMFPTTAEELAHDIREASHAVKEQYAARRLDLRGELDSLKQKTRNDFLGIAEECKRLKQSVGSNNSSGNSTEENFRRQIRDYEQALRSDSAVPDANATIVRSLPSADELSEYYQSRPDMKDLTLEKDLCRMQYTLYTREGQRLTSPEEILSYAEAHPHEDEILWRAANQSLFGDVMCLLTSESGIVRPQLSGATFADDCSIAIDLASDKPHLRGECFMNLCIPSEDGERLSMAGVLVSIYFCPAEKVARAQVLHVSPGRLLTEEEVNGAARSLLA